jgi:hypothetical protein
MKYMWNFELANERLKIEGRTRSWLAEYCGIPLRSLYHYLSGRRAPPVPVMKLIAMALECSEADLAKAPKKAKTA